MKSTLFILFLAICGSLVATPISFTVTVNTGITPGTLGNLDFQFNPANGSSPAAVATVSLFSPTTGLNGPSATGDVSGDLTTQLVIGNSTGFNDYFVGYTYPAQITFDLQLSGPAIDTPTDTGFGSTFFFALYDSGGTNALQSTSGDGSLFSLDILNTGATTLNDNATNGASVTVTPLIVTPEPASFLLVALGGIGAALRRRRAR